VPGRVARSGSRRAGACRLRAALLVVLALLGLALPEQPLAQTVRTPQVIRSDAVEVVFWSGHDAVAQRALEIATRPQRMPGLPDDPALTAGTIYLAPSPFEFDSLTGGRVPHWGAGVAIPSLRTIVLPLYPAPGGGDRDPGVTLRHELAHLALHAYLPTPIPRWFDEGYATWVSGGWDQAAAWQIRFAFLVGRAPPLDSLALTWPRGAEQARLAYLLSASAVQHLVEIGGEPGFGALLEAWRREGSFDSALRLVYGMTPGQFERGWATMVRRRYGWLLALSQVTVLWGFFAVVLLALWVVRRRRNRERLDEMERDDRINPSPATVSGDYLVDEDGFSAYDVVSKADPESAPEPEDPARGVDAAPRPE